MTSTQDIRDPGPSAGTLGAFDRDVYCMLGLPFDAVTEDQAVETVAQAMRRKQRMFLSTPNLNFLIASLKQPAFRDSVLRSDLSVMDGMPLVWLARLLKIPIRERVAGSTLFERLRLCAGEPFKVFFFGGEPGVASQAHTAINAAPGAMVSTGFLDPGFGAIETMSGAETINVLNAASPDFLVVSLGAVKGQAWIERNRHALTAPVISHLGAVVNFVAGSTTRAPKAFQRSGLEWLWRIKEEPLLWRRYARDAVAGASLLGGRVIPLMFEQSRSGNRRGASGTVELIRRGSNSTIRLAGCWAGTDLTSLRQALATAVDAGNVVELDMSAVEDVDARFLGMLMLLYGYQSNRGRALIVSPPLDRARRLCILHGAQYLLRSLPADVAGKVPTRTTENAAHGR